MGWGVVGRGKAHSVVTHATWCVVTAAGGPHWFGGCQDGWSVLSRVGFLRALPGLMAAVCRAGFGVLGCLMH